jgi:hypothetical protein
MKPQQVMNAGPVKIRFGPVAYPIYRITNADVFPMKVQWSNRNVLRLYFDNGGKEYFDFHDDTNQWLQVLLQAKPNAPLLNYETVPAVKSGVEGAVGRSYKMLLMLIGGIAACGVLSCILAAAAGALTGK